MNIGPDAIVGRLVSEFGYTEQRAQEAVQKLSNSHPSVQEAFEKWWRGEGLDERLEVQGYTAQGLVEKRGFNPMNAFLTMDWLLREPDKAARRLRKGRDYFLVSDAMKAKYEQRKEEYQRRKEQKDELK